MYFEFDNYGNLWYSYNRVNGSIDAHFANPEGIEAYLDDEVFIEDVKNSYKRIDLTGDNQRDIDRFLAKQNRVADWLRKKMTQHEMQSSK